MMFPQLHSGNHQIAKLTYSEFDIGLVIYYTL